MLKKNLLTALFLLVGLAGSVFAQGGNASLGGSVQDPTKALIPGVTVTATNVDTNVSQTQLTNESGTYNFPALQPGTYKVSAELSGFKKAIHENVVLGFAVQARENFTLEVGAVNQVVDIQTSSVEALRSSSSSVGDVLTAAQIESLPMVGNNVLSLLDTLPGLRLSPVGNAFDTINGLNMDYLNVTRDGLTMINPRYDAAYTGQLGVNVRQTLSSTTLLPDLVGEIRLVLSPADAELGRGNAQMQISTRSGTNRYNGSASWNVRNPALDANTWANNHTAANGQNFTPLAWYNNHQYTIAYGGPVSIPGLYNGKGKTFFYSLWDQNIHKSRDIVIATVPTDTARMGIYRYWQNYTPIGWNTTTAGIVAPTYPLTATTATAVSVDPSGKPVPPPANIDGSPYTGKLICFSVFGNQRLDPNNGFALVPFTQADCPSGTGYQSLAVFGSTASGGTYWDSNRRTFDTTGFIAKQMMAMPHANFFGAGDGLNIAQDRYNRGRTGDNSGNGGFNSQIGADPTATNNKQINIKVDHNFTPKHKVAVSYSYQRDNNLAGAYNWPSGLPGTNYRVPHVITVNATSTLSSRMINEFRFGMNRIHDLTQPAWFSPDPAVKKAAEGYLLSGGQSLQNPKYQYLAVVSPSAGSFGDNNGIMAVGQTDFINLNPTYVYGDTLSWSRGKHSFKLGVELRLPRTAGNGSTQPYPTVTLGNNGGATATAATFTVATNYATELPGLLNSSIGGATIPRTQAQMMLYYLNGSVNSASQAYWVNNYSNIASGKWDDYSTSGERIRNQIYKEWAAFVKDDFKVTRRLTVNLGVRWEYAASPYLESGLTAAVLGYGYGAFGSTRTAQSTLAAFQKDPFSLFMRSGNLFLTGYGTNALSCQNGVTQGSLPISTCDPSSLSSIAFVGPKSPNPNITAEPENWYNIGPAVGFAYSLPWFGEGKTTIRAGYQQTFGTAGRTSDASANGTETEIANTPGATNAATTSVSDTVFQNILATRAINLADIQALTPVRPTLSPGAAIPVYSRAASPSVYDPKFQSPYTQNVNFSVTRQINRQFTLDMRYVGTFGRKQKGTIDINTNNVYHNPELLQALKDARQGGCNADSPAYAANYTSKGISPCDIGGDPVLLDQMLAGINLLAAATTSTDNSGVSRFFGPVGSVVSTDSSGKAATPVFQSGAAQLRRSGTFQQNLAYGDFNTEAGFFISTVPSTAVPGLNVAGGRVGFTTDAAGLTIAQPTIRNGCDRMALGYTIVQQTTVAGLGAAAGTNTGAKPGAQIANTGAPIPLRCFPMDYIQSNPQFATITYNSNYGHTNYHSFQTSLTARPTNGVSTQFTWTWAKSMYLCTQGVCHGGNGYYDPADRNLNFAPQNINAHSFRMNGTFELPIGPNKLFLGNTSGWVARALERWQTSVIFNAATGTPSTLDPMFSHCYSVCGYDITSPNYKSPRPHLAWYGSSGGNIYALPGSKQGAIITPYIGAIDPMCSDPSQVTQGDKMGTNLGGSDTTRTNPTTGATIANVCNVFSLAARNPDGSIGENLLRYSKPGKVGNLGQATVVGFGQWSLDMSASKSFKVAESKTFQMRIDATNVLNHPTPGLPTLGASNMGGVTTKTNQRAFQGQLRVSF